MGLRRAARIRAFQTIYSMHFAKTNGLEDLRTLFEYIPMPGNSVPKKQEKVCAFAWELVEGVFNNKSSIDAIISRSSHNWRIDRLGLVELALLRLAVFEMIFIKDTPISVVISEILNIADSFGDDKAKKFINGLLDAAAKDAQIPHVVEQS